MTKYEIFQKEKLFWMKFFDFFAKLSSSFQKKKESLDVFLKVSCLNKTAQRDITYQWLKLCSVVFNLWKLLFPSERQQNLKLITCSPRYMQTLYM